MKSQLLVVAHFYHQVSESHSWGRLPAQRKGDWTPFILRSFIHPAGRFALRNVKGFYFLKPFRVTGSQIVLCFSRLTWRVSPWQRSVADPRVTLHHFVRVLCATTWRQLLGDKRPDAETSVVREGACSRCTCCDLTICGGQMQLEWVQGCCGVSCCRSAAAQRGAVPPTSAERGEAVLIFTRFNNPRWITPGTFKRPLRWSRSLLWGCGSARCLSSPACRHGE